MRKCDEAIMRKLLKFSYILNPATCILYHASSIIKRFDLLTF